MLIAARVHPFPSRTRKLSSPAPKILGWRRPGKIGFRQHKKTTCANRWFFCACGGQVAGRSLPLALPGVKRQPCVRGGWLGVIGGSLARKRTAGSSSPGNPSSPPQDFFRIFKNSQGFFTPFFQDIMVNSVLRFSPFRPACHLGNCTIFFFFFP